MNSLGIVEVIHACLSSTLSLCLRFGTTEQLFARRSVTDMHYALSYNSAGPSSAARYADAEH